MVQSRCERVLLRGVWTKTAGAGSSVNRYVPRCGRTILDTLEITVYLVGSFRARSRLEQAHPLVGCQEAPITSAKLMESGPSLRSAQPLHPHLLTLAV
jgi:hypothetical protein